MPDTGPTIQVSATPNPNAMKFNLGRKVVDSGSRSFSTRFDAMEDPLAAALFEVPGVAGLFFMADFITVTKDPAAAWEGIVPEVTSVIRDHLSGS